MTDPNRTHEVAGAEVAELLDLLAEHGVPVWLDGGWAVDACLGHQTRAHRDLDVLIEEGHLSAAVAALHDRGYRPARRDGTTPWNFVLADGHGREIDIDVITFDTAGNGVYGPARNGQVYPAAAFTGTGTIHNRPVNCFSPEWLVIFHTGYDVDADDWADVSALCQRYGIPVPEDYAEFQADLGALGGGPARPRRM